MTKPGSDSNGHLVQNGKQGQISQEFVNGDNPGVEIEIKKDFDEHKQIGLAACCSSPRKIFHTCCIYASFSMIGAIIAKTGPALLDLQSITRVGLEEGSWLVTALYIGYTIGALLNAFLYQRCNRPLMFCVCMIGMSITVVVIPWCTLYGIMFTAHFVIGLFQGIADAAGNAEIVHIWKSSSQVALILLHLLFCIGGVISPMVIAPFLLRIVNNTTNNHEMLPNIYESQNISETPVYDVNGSMTNDVNLGAHSSRIYIAYSLSSAASFLVAVAFFVSYFFPYDDKADNTHESKGDVNKRSPLPRKVKIIALVIMLSMATVFGGIANSFVALVSPFCVKYLGWTKTNGSMVTSMINIFVVVGGILGIVFSKFLKTVTYAGIQILIAVTAFIILLISVEAHANVGVWIAASLYGYAKSVLLPLLIAWTNEKYLKVSGKVSSAFFVAASGGSATNPLFLGFVMESISMKWFSYIFVIEGICGLLLFIASFFLTRYVDKLRAGDVIDVIDVKQ